MSDDADMDALIAEAGRLPEGAAQVALWEEAVRLADARRDEGAGFRVRAGALGPVCFAGRYDLLAVLFAWCLAYLDRHPAVDPGPTLWAYRWAAGFLPGFLGVPLDRLDATWADMRDRYAAAGYSPRPVWKTRQLMLRKYGDPAGAAAAQARYLRESRDRMSDSPDVDAFNAVHYHAFAGDDRATVAAAEPFLADRFRDSELRIGAWHRALLPLARLGRAGEAAARLADADRLTAARPRYHGSGAEPLTFLVCTGRVAPAVRHFNRDFPPAATRPGEGQKLFTYPHALFFARELVRQGKVPALKVPAGLIPGVTGTRTTPGVVRDWLEVALPELCARADARNGNGYHTSKLAELDEFARLARTLAA